MHGCIRPAPAHLVVFSSLINKRFHQFIYSYLIILINFPFTFLKLFKILFHNYSIIDASKRVNHTYEEIRAAEDVRFVVVDMETSRISGAAGGPAYFFAPWAAASLNPAGLRGCAPQTR